MTAVLDGAQFSAPPRFEELAPARTIGTGVWLFVVDDGSPMPAISRGGAGQVQMGRLNLDNLDTPIEWRVVAGPPDDPHIADHWLVFAHGFYSVVFSANYDRNSYLLKLDSDFTRVAKIPIVLNGIDDGREILANDMFLVEEADGVTVGHFLPGFGHRTFRFNTAGVLQGTVDIGAVPWGPPSVFKHTDGASALQTPSGFMVLAPDTLNPQVVSGLKRLEFTSDWAPQPQSSVVLAWEPATNYSMTSGVLLNSGFLIVNFRVRYPVPEDPLVESGSLVRLIVAPNNSIVARDVLQPWGVNRPHTTLVGDRLITAWDELPSGGIGPPLVRLRVDRILPAAADLSIAKSDSTDPIVIGADLTYTLTIENHGPDWAFGVSVTDALPPQTTFVSCTATGGRICGGANNNRAATFSTIASGRTRRVSLVTSIACSVTNGSLINNTARVWAARTDPDELNNFAFETTTAFNPAPVLSNLVVDKPELWLPNHELVDVKVDYNVSDNCPLPVDACSLSVSSNEPDDGLGDGDVAPDIEIVDVHNVRLRAERSGAGHGRTYSIAVICTDSGGASSTQIVRVNVPHGQP